MQQKKILIIRLGKQRDDKSYEKLAKRKSKLLQFTLMPGYLKLDSTLKVNKDVTVGEYDTDALAAYIQEQKNLRLDEYDLVLGCLDRPHSSEDNLLAEVSKDIERNKFYILCTTNIMERLENGHVSLLNYLLNLIYGMYVRKYLGIDPEYHESPGCLLDYGFLERDMIAGCIKPVLCEDCTAGITDKETAALMNKEMKKISIPFYIRLLDTIKAHTMLSMVIAVIASMFFGMLSNYMAAVLLEGTIWQAAFTTAVPLVIMVFMIMPFIGRKK